MAERSGEVARPAGSPRSSRSCPCSARPTPRTRRPAGLTRNRVARAWSTALHEVHRRPTKVLRRATLGRCADRTRLAHWDRERDAGRADRDQGAGAGSRPGPRRRCCCSSRWRTRTTSCAARRSSAASRRTARRCDRAVTWAIATFVDGRAFPMFGAALRVRRRPHRRAARPAPPGRPGGCSGGAAWCWSSSASSTRCCSTSATSWRRTACCSSSASGRSAGRTAGCWSSPRCSSCSRALPGDGSMSISTDPPDPSMLPPDLLSQLADRVVVAAVHRPARPDRLRLPVPGRPLGGPPARPRAAGAAPEAAAPSTAVVGIGAAVARRPAGRADAGRRHRAAERTRRSTCLGPLHDATGILGGFGYAALLALLSIRLAPRAGRVTGALAATGQRSMTCYLCQSVVWAVVFTPLPARSLGHPHGHHDRAARHRDLAGHRGPRRPDATAGHRGPFEVLIRRVTYGRPAARAQ